MNHGSSKSAKIVLSKYIILCKKSTEYFKKKELFKNINLGVFVKKKKNSIFAF